MPSETRPRAHALVHDQRGQALLLVLVLIVGAMAAVSTAVLLTVSGERSAAAMAERTRLTHAAEAVLAEMQELLLARVQASAGALDEGDLRALNELAASLALPAGVSLDAGRTGWTVVAVREGERIPSDAVPVREWSDQPRRTYQGVPPSGGLVAARTILVALTAAVTGADGRRVTLRRDLAVSRVPPHQHALYVAGDAEICADETARSWIAGPVRADGTLLAAACAHVVRYAGSVEARDGVSAPAPEAHFLFGGAGPVALGTITRATAEADPAAALARWGGRVRITPALGGALARSRFSSAEVAGTGECEVVPSGGSNCGGAARYFPALQVQRVTSGAGTEYVAVCEAAYAGGGCAGVLGAISYRPWPFSGGLSPGQAASDPAAPGQPWQGLLPDARREARCTATVAGRTYRTARCPTNLFGFVADLGALPALPGGLLSVRGAAGQAPSWNPSGAQEVLLLTNAAALAGPLTIHSEVPVYVLGNFNVTPAPGYNGPPPAMIQAPRITVLPNEAAAQLLTSAVWDSVPPADQVIPASLPLRAESNVTLFVVLRTEYCRSVAGRYFGGVWEGAPSVLGDWSQAGLMIIGAVEAADATGREADCSRFAAPFGGSPSGTPTLQPLSRTLLFDERLLHPAFPVPGSWRPENMVFDGTLPGRTPTRQARSLGGTVVVHRVRGDFTPLAPPAAMPIPPPRPLPAAPAPLP